MRKPILYTEDVHEVEGYIAIPIDDYVLHYDPTRADIDDILELQDDIRSSDNERSQRFWDTVEEI
tara:strand:- start:280 stop:474 length:195 start_codon:yes stop_codon:yes gene_type:complete